MSRWLAAVLKRVGACTEAGKVRFTHKALTELAELDLGLDEADAVDVLRRLTGRDGAARVRSRQTGEWMYVFKPVVAATRVYVKIIVRDDCVVVSFHEDFDEQEEDGGY